MVSSNILSTSIHAHFSCSSRLPESLMSLCVAKSGQAFQKRHRPGLKIPQRRWEEDAMEHYSNLSSRNICSVTSRSSLPLRTSLLSCEPPAISLLCQMPLAEPRSSLGVLGMYSASRSSLCQMPLAEPRSSLGELGTYSQRRFECLKTCSIF